MLYDKGIDAYEVVQRIHLLNDIVSLKKYCCSFNILMESRYVCNHLKV